LNPSSHSFSWTAHCSVPNSSASSPRSCSITPLWSYFIYSTPGYSLPNPQPLRSYSSRHLCVSFSNLLFNFDNCQSTFTWHLRTVWPLAIACDIPKQSITIHFFKFWCQPFGILLWMFASINYSETIIAAERTIEEKAVDFQFQWIYCLINAFCPAVNQLQRAYHVKSCQQVYLKYQLISTQLIFFEVFVSLA
jgi:hypothetical protein